MTMDAREAFYEEYGYRIKDQYPPDVVELMCCAYISAYRRNDRDAIRYRFIRDEVVQDAAVSPFCIGVGILSDKPNIAGNYDIKLWAASWGIDADVMLDKAISLRESKRGII